MFKATTFLQQTWRTLSSISVCVSIVTALRSVDIALLVLDISGCMLLYIYHLYDDHHNLRSLFDQVSIKLLNAGVFSFSDAFSILTLPGLMKYLAMRCTCTRCCNCCHRQLDIKTE